MNTQALLTVAEVADLLKVSPRWVYSSYEQGRLPGGKVGRYLRFRSQDIEHFVQQQFLAG